MPFEESKGKTVLDFLDKLKHPTNKIILSHLKQNSGSTCGTIFSEKSKKPNAYTQLNHLEGLNLIKAKKVHPRSNEYSLNFEGIKSLCQALSLFPLVLSDRVKDFLIFDNADGMQHILDFNQIRKLHYSISCLENTQLAELYDEIEKAGKVRNMNLIKVGPNDTKEVKKKKENRDKVFITTELKKLKNGGLLIVRKESNKTFFEVNYDYKDWLINFIDEITNLNFSFYSAKKMYRRPKTRRI